MKIGDVLKKEREATGLNRHRRFSVEEMASALEIPTEEYRTLESGSSDVEVWFPLLCRLAVEFETPTSRLLADSGQAKDARPGQAGTLVRLRREERGFTVDEIAETLRLPVADYVEIEKGRSGIERYGPLLLRFSELIEQPIFNLYLPCGVPYDQLDDYP